MCVCVHRHGDEVGDVATPEDDTRGGVSGLEGDTQARPHGVVAHRQHRREDEGVLV